MKFLLPFFLFIASSLSLSIWAQTTKTLEVGTYSFEVFENKINKIPNLKIVIKNSESQMYPDYKSWFRLRYENSGDRMGEREYWNAPLPPQKYYPEMEININPSEDSEWHKIYRIKEPKAYYALLSFIDPFYLKYQDDFSSLIYSNSSLGFYTINLGVTPQVSKKLTQDFLQDYLDGNYIGEIKKSRYYTDIEDKPTLIVTHASVIFDQNKVIKVTADKLVEKFKNKNHNVAYLIHNDMMEDYTWFLKDKNPDIALFSHGGEHSLLIKNPNVTMIGGYFDQCFRRSVQDTVTRFYLSKPKFKELNINFPMSGIYTGEKTLLDDYNKNPRKFLTIVLDSLFWKKYDPTDDSDDPENEAIGEMDMKNFTFKIYLDDLHIETKGNGENVVNLLFKKY